MTDAAALPAEGDEGRVNREAVPGGRMNRVLLARSAWLALACAGLHASTPAAALDERLRRLDVPEDARVSAWAGAADRTLVAWIAPSAASADPPDDRAFDLHLLVVATGSGELVARSTREREYVAEAFDPEGIKLVATDFALAPGKPSFAIDVRSEHRGCAWSTVTARALFELDGHAIRRVLDETDLQAHTRFCGTEETTDASATIEPARTRHAGHADLVRRAQITGTVCDAKQRCRDIEQRSRDVLRFDGERYVRETPPKRGKP